MDDCPPGGLEPVDDWPPGGVEEREPLDDCPPAGGVEDPAGGLLLVDEREAVPEVEEAENGTMLLLDDVKNWPPGGPEVEDPDAVTKVPGPPGVED